MNNQSVVLYGAGWLGQNEFINLARENIHVEAFCDRNAKKIIRYCGCDVYTFEEGIVKYRNLPFIVTIDNKKVKEGVMRSLEKEGITVYDSVSSYYLGGEKEADIDMMKCGNAASYYVAKKMLKKDSVAYCFGIGYDYSFERELVEKHGMKVYAFDPSPEVIEKMKKETLEGLYYYPYGIADKDEVKTFYMPRYSDNYSEYFSYWTSENDKIEMEVYTLESLMKKFGHKHIDLLKMDVEGTEFNVLPDILNVLDIDMICLETHARIFPNSVEMMWNIRELFRKNKYVLISDGIYEHTYIKSYLIWKPEE